MEFSRDAIREFIKAKDLKTPEEVHEALKDLFAGTLEEMLAASDGDLVLVSSKSRFSLVDSGIISTILEANAKMVIEVAENEEIPRVELEEDFATLLTHIFQETLGESVEPNSPGYVMIQDLRRRFSRFLREYVERPKIF